MEGNEERRSPAPTTPVFRGATGDPITLDEIFTALADKRRRCLLYALRDGEAARSVEDLTEHLATIEAQLGVTDDAEHARQVTLSLVHQHLPKLDRLGILDFDQRSATVRYHGHPLIDRWLARTREMDGL